MNQFSFDYMKTLVEISSELNLEYTNKDALLFQVLKTAMRFVKSKASAFYSVKKVNEIFLTAYADENEYRALDNPVAPESFANMIFEIKRVEVFNGVDENPDLYKSVRAEEGIKIENAIAFPLLMNNKVTGIVALFNRYDGSDYDEVDEQLCNILSGFYGSIVPQKLISIEEELKKNRSEKKDDTVVVHDFIAESPVIVDLMSIVKKAAQTNVSVLITGESGAGKELFAEQLYLNSKRKDKPFIRVNCAALTETLMESELFGHEKGAFTSADTVQKGRFEMADGGTIFLDEVGEIPLVLQAKLLRVLQDKQFERVGSSQTRTTDVRIIAATNRNLEEMVKQGKFREDLYFRLNILPIRVPPLRERKEDILPLANLFLRKSLLDVNKDIKGFSDDAQKALKAYSWPGNVRDLENSVARACIICEGHFIEAKDLGIKPKTDLTSIKDSVDFAFINDVASNIYGDKSLKTALNVFKRSYLIKILEDCGWNQTKAGKVLGIQRTYVSRLMNELQIRGK